jgi:hypothetical protein
MPRYFIHQVDPGRRFDDEEGLMFPDLKAVLSDTEQAGRELLIEQLRGGQRVTDRVLEIHDEHGMQLERVVLRDLIA